MYKQIKRNHWNRNPYIKQWIRNNLKPKWAKRSVKRQMPWCMNMNMFFGSCFQQKLFGVCCVPLFVDYIMRFNLKYAMEIFFFSFVYRVYELRVARSIFVHIYLVNGWKVCLFAVVVPVSYIHVIYRVSF